MSAAYIRRQDWTPTTCHQEKQKAATRHGMTGHPKAVQDKINRILLERGIMPKPRKDKP